METSPIGALPPEVRSEIYEHALTYSEPIALLYRLVPSPTDQCWHLKGPDHAAALTYTCKQARSECGDLIFLLNAFELRGIGIEELLPVLTAFRKDRKFALTGSISILPAEFDAFQWWYSRMDLLFAEGLSLAVARLRWCREGVGADRLALKCRVAYMDDDAVHVLYIELDTQHLLQSWRLVDWQMMGEILAHPEHAKLPQIYAAFQGCGKRLRHMGLLPKS